ncbi:MAG: nucleotide sugar dehydrogenase [Myxococcota bacterium]|nr:nucleotide sugar dehydrogenase [Myxococcota bacterium]
MAEARGKVEAPDSVAVIGLGRVGLPLAVLLQTLGFRVVGVDVDADRVAALHEGRFPFMEKGGEDQLAKALELGFEATTDVSRTADVDAIVLTLGTPVDEHMNPDFTQIQAVLAALERHLKPGQLLVLRSTLAPGTTELVGRLLESHTGLRVGEDLFLAFCPERIAEGNSFEEIREIPQIVGGTDPESTARASALFARFCAEVFPTDPVSAELAKLYCNMYRYIDFAIANEFMMIAQHHGAEIHEVVRLVNDGYRRSGLKSPGLTSGPCLYKDGFFLTNHLPFGELISTSWKINETVPAFLIDLVKEQRSLEGLTAGILGLSFKRNIDDTRNSLAYKLKKLLWMENCQILMHDPFVESDELDRVLAESDVLFVTMNHDFYRTKIGELLARAKPGALVCDVWNITGVERILFPASEGVGS